MKIEVRTRLWIEIGLAALTGTLFLITLFWRDWIERFFGLYLDGDSGALEWLIVGGLLFVTLALTGLARLEWRRAQGEPSH